MPNARRLLVVDDDQDLRDTLTEQLALYDEFEILSADTAASAINQAKADRIDLAIVDVALPDMDGREAVKIMRRNGFRSPKIMLTGQASEADTVLGLEAGANDYVVKPFKFPVLLARIRAQLRQYRRPHPDLIDERPWTARAPPRRHPSQSRSPPPGGLRRQRISERSQPREPRGARHQGLHRDGTRQAPGRRQAKDRRPVDPGNATKIEAGRMA